MGLITMGYIYIIRNTLNKKVYIGQTIQTVESRFKQHIMLANRGRATAKIYIAMRKLGVENFYVEQLVECEDSELNKYEQYYVEQYDSLNNGYNSVYPCSSTGKRPVHDYEDKVADMYTSGYSFAKIAKECNISTHHVNDIVLAHELKREYINMGSQGNNTPAKSLVMYTKEFEPIRTFESIKQAYLWIIDNTNFAVTEYGAYAFIDVACKNGNISYGHRWQLQSDLVYDNKIFRTKFDKEAYINGEYAYQPEGRHYWITDNALKSVKTFKTKVYCIDCGKELTSKRNNRCLECANKAKNIINQKYKESYNKICVRCGRRVTSLNAKGLCASCYNVEAKGKSPKPSKEELKQLLDKGLQKKQIAEMYGRTDSTVHYWIKSYGLS